MLCSKPLHFVKHCFIACPEYISLEVILLRKSHCEKHIIFHPWKEIFPPVKRRYNMSYRRYLFHTRTWLYIFHMTSYMWLGVNSKWRRSHWSELNVYCMCSLVPDSRYVQFWIDRSYNDIKIWLAQWDYCANQILCLINFSAFDIIVKKVYHLSLTITSFNIYKNS